MMMIIHKLVNQIGSVILGKEEQIKLALSCLLAKGHLLIEDLPGMGKTTLAQCLAMALGLKYDRIQFTSDLLPADILGVAVFDREQGKFSFHPGAIFTEVLLADEINRATPKTQSALLEAMAEHQVTVEGETRPLPESFFVIATQNPSVQIGTYPLPESQLDRFLMRISLGYPDPVSERKLLEGTNPQKRIKNIEPLLTKEQLTNLQAKVLQVKASASLLDYLQRLIGVTRKNRDFHHGLSPRGAIAWLQAAKAWAVIEGRDFVLPDDIQKVAVAVIGHRLHAGNAEINSHQVLRLVTELLHDVDMIA